MGSRSVGGRRGGAAVDVAATAAAAAAAVVAAAADGVGQFLRNESGETIVESSPRPEHSADACLPCSGLSRLSEEWID